FLLLLSFPFTLSVSRFTSFQFQFLDSSKRFGEHGSVFSFQVFLPRRIRAQSELVALNRGYSGIKNGLAQAASDVTNHESRIVLHKPLRIIALNCTRSLQFRTPSVRSRPRSRSSLTS